MMHFMLSYWLRRLLMIVEDRAEPLIASLFQRAVLGWHYSLVGVIAPRVENVHLVWVNALSFIDDDAEMACNQVLLLSIKSTRSRNMIDSESIRVSWLRAATSIKWCAEFLRQSHICVIKCSTRQSFMIESMLRFENDQCDCKHVIPWGACMRICCKATVTWYLVYLLWRLSETSLVVCIKCRKDISFGMFLTNLQSTDRRVKYACHCSVSCKVYYCFLLIPFAVTLPLQADGIN